MLRVLFYGQSISTPTWTDLAVARLRADYPNVAFDVRNLAIGGFAADRLERTTARDIAGFQPDLIVFHVYGDASAYERIVRTLRSRSAADVVVATDHVVTPPEPFCDTGLHLRWSPPPGCKGHLYFRQRIWTDYMSGRWIPTLATRYGLAVEPRRARWQAYLVNHRLPPTALLADEVHPNAAGWQLMADLFTTWFEHVVARADQGRVLDRAPIATLAPPPPGRTIRYRLTGSRFELVSGAPLAGRVAVRVDGRSPAALDGCWLDSRVSPLPTVPDWPALARVGVDPGYHRPDRWTVRVEPPEEGRRGFGFTLNSATHGLDGRGRSDEPFVSPSGRVRIDPSDWMLQAAREASGRAVQAGTGFSWDRRFICSDEPAVMLPNGATEQRYVLATGLPNTAHTVEVSLAPGAPKVTGLRIHRPPLRS